MKDQSVYGSHQCCFEFPGLRAMPRSPFQLENPHGPHGPHGVAQYIVASPCHAVSAAAALHPPRSCANSTCNCTSFRGGARAALQSPAFIFAGVTCVALGNATTRAAALLDPANASAGVAISWTGGGVGGRHRRLRRRVGVVFNMVCDPKASADAGPAGPVEPHVPSNCVTTLTWRHPAACHPKPVACPAPTPAPPPLDTRPHLIFILIDDLGWNDIGIHDPRVLTPTLDQLARESVVLERHYVYRYCSPTRSSFLSGRLPYHDHQTNGGLLGSHAGTNLNMTLLPAKLQRAGYRTAMRGKWHCGFSRPEQIPARAG